MGGSSKVTVGYWYKLLLHYGLSRGPVDAFLEFRGGDRTAWKGQLTSSGTISINAPDLWGGEKSEGGIKGDADVMFGEQDQAPNEWLRANQGERQPAYRGKLTFLFKGGRFGINPYPKSVSFKFRRIFSGWDSGCWYPEKAAIPMGSETGLLATAAVTNGNFVRVSPGADDWTAPISAPDSGANVLLFAGDRIVAWSGTDASYTTDAVTWNASSGTLGGSGGARDSVYFKGRIYIGGGVNGFYASSDGAASFQSYLYPEFPRVGQLAASPERIVSSYGAYDGPAYSDTGLGAWMQGAPTGLGLSSDYPIAWGNGQFRIGGPNYDSSAPGMVASPNAETWEAETLPALPGVDTISALAYGFIGGAHVWVAGTQLGKIIFKRDDDAWAIAADALGTPARRARFIGTRFVMLGDSAAMASVDGSAWAAFAAGEGMDGGTITDVAGGTIDTRSGALIAMNPAHIMLDAQIAADMQAEPIENIDLVSFAAAADRLYAEGFGLCTTYDHARETPEQFQQRIANVAGMNLSQSRIDGRYRLDLVRGDYVLDDLPILSDYDILEFSREPTDPNDSVNEVSVSWFDPVTREVRVTQPLHSLGAIQSARAVISELGEYPEIPVESLALRVAARDLKAKSSPGNRFKLTTTRRPWKWRAGTFFRLQAPRRGIADMVCLVGEISAGTPLSGAMSLVAIQDVTGMPATTYVDIEPGVDTAPSDAPALPSAQRAIEAPYVELAGALPAVDLAAITEDAGFLIAMAARGSSGINFTMHTRAAGEAYVDQGVSDWCPVAIIVEAAGQADTEFTVEGGLDLDRVEIGTAALWGAELVRVDALDIEAGTITLGRGVGDTVAQGHAAGERIWFYDAWGATDEREYVDGELVEAKILPRTSSRELSPDLVIPVDVVMNQRQARPYPPADLRIDDVTEPAGIVTGTFDISWAHRDRVLQADQLIDWFAASVGPEPGTTYAVRIVDVADLEVALIEFGPITDPEVTGVELPDFIGGLRISVASTRDGLDSFQSAAVEIVYDSGTTDTEIRTTETGEFRLVEGPSRVNIRITED